MVVKCLKRIIWNVDELSDGNYVVEPIDNNSYRDLTEKSIVKKDDLLTSSIRGSRSDPSHNQVYIAYSLSVCLSLSLSLSLSWSS